MYIHAILLSYSCCYMEMRKYSYFGFNTFELYSKKSQKVRKIQNMNIFAYPYSNNYNSKIQKYDMYILFKSNFHEVSMFLNF